MTIHENETRYEDCLNCAFYEEGYCSRYERYERTVKPHDSCERFYPAEFCEPEKEYTDLF